METVRCLCCVLLLLLIASCQKKQDTFPKLISFSDNNNKYTVNYNGNSISDIQVDSGAAAPYIIATYSYATNFIRANLHANTGYTRIDYFLKNGSLPLSIKKYKKVTGQEALVSSTDFYYHGTGTTLDSVVHDDGIHYNFTPVYSGSNITDYYLSTDYGSPTLSGNFLYYPIENVFRYTNPLLFVYCSPVFQFETFLLPRIFSANTFKKFNGGSFVYNTDAKGNLSVEDYGNIYPYKRTYLYK